MKILLIHPQNQIQRYTTGIFGKPQRYAAITMPTLAALVPKEIGAVVEVIDEMVEAVNLDQEADLVGITAITSAAPHAYELARHFKKKGATVVMGGVHASLMPAEALQYADAIVCGYAERTWPQLLRDFKEGRLQQIYRHDGAFSSSDIIGPDRSLIKRQKYIAPDTLEMSRGCSKSCEFCVSHQFYKHYITKPIANVLNEISTIKAKMISFLDPNLVGSHSFALQFFRELKKINKWWMGCVSIDVMKNDELFNAMVESGCKGVLIGFESVNPESLKVANKTFSQVAEYRNIIRKLHDHGILVQGTIVLGFDTDDQSSFDRTIEFIIQSKLDIAQITAYTPFPGTMAFTRLKNEGRILTYDWNLYNGQNVVFKPSKMSAQELQEGLAHVWKETYRPIAIFKRLWGPPWLLKPVIALSNFYIGHFMNQVQLPMEKRQLLAAR